MGQYSNEPERVWDEYDWERFLQQQDRKTERYMDLLEKYMDHPNRDQIIAQEMGWQNFVDLTGEDNEMDFSYQEDSLRSEGQNFEGHPLYQACFALTVWLDKLVERKDREANSPSMVKVSNQTAIANAKLAAALSDDELDEIGMTIAYLKRALKAISTALDAVPSLVSEIKLSKRDALTLRKRLFHIRDSIIELMGLYRAQWRKRFGSA